MEIDDLLSQMNREISETLSNMNKSLSNLDNTLPYSPSDPKDYTEVVDEEISDDFVFCPECGTKLPAGSNFCSNCGSKIDEVDTVEKEHDFEYQIDGIIMTDTGILSKKYGESQEKVFDLISNYIDYCRGKDINWILLDINNYKRDLGESTWMDYSDVLQSFMIECCIAPSPHLSLFIIGGNDVIPQPAEDNPCGDPCDERESIVHADFYYCFYGKLPVDFFDFNNARCNVARLPLEMGKMHTSFEDDVILYLNRCNNLYEKGIYVGNAVMTTNSDWIPASREMSRNLPTPHMDNADDEVLDNMFLSPNVLVDDMDEDLKERYFDSIGKADMLVFNLHGACKPKNSGFYSNELAFSIDTLANTGATLFNTVACWGARYINYKRKDSMLLNAIYNHEVMLYSGSCVPALGKCGCFQNDSTWRIRPAAYSESFMSRFCEYECIGSMPVGEAFLKAKCDYYNSSRSIEDDECILGTVLMFNLYGNPILRTLPNTRAIEEMQQDDGSKMMRMPFRKMQKQVVMKSKTACVESKQSLLEGVRGAVDDNLRAIHETIIASLYNVLGLKPRELCSVETFTTTDAQGCQQKGYLYNYKKQSGVIETCIRAKVDMQGRLLDATQTK